MKVKNKYGFTLIELLVVIAIIGILAAVAITAYVGVSKKATRSEAYTNLDSLRLLEEQFFAERAVYTASAANGPAIRLLLPGFNPGGNPPGTGIYYRYVVTQNVALVPPVPVPFAGVTVAQTPCFVATATGLAGSRVAGDVFAIDCNNNKNF
jgi:prepilin-type N-terminal cleavage/methylation domain-containing protein